MSKASHEANKTPYSVNWWGSHPDADNDDCWTGEDYATLAEAREAFASVPGNRYSPSHTVAFVELDGPDVYEVRPNPAFDRARCEREDRADDQMWKNEIATQAGMGLGVEAYNDYMGW